MTGGVDDWRRNIGMDCDTTVIGVKEGEVRDALLISSK